MPEIVFPLELQMKRETVGHLHDVLISLGYQIAETEKSANRFGTSTRDAVLDYQKKQGLKPSGEVDKATAAHLSKRIDALQFVVRGVIQYRDGAPGPGLTVKAFNRKVGADDTPLGEAATDTHGNYSITYTIEQLGGKPPADLVVALYQDDNQLQISEVIFNAGAEVTKDFIIPVTVVPEFLRFTQTIQPLLHNKIGIGGLAQAQIKFLGQKTGVDAEMVSRLAQSHALAAGDQTLAVFYYGMLSQNLPTDPAALLTRPRATLQTALGRAVTFNQIPPLQSREIDTILDTTLPRLRAENLLKPAPTGQKASLGDLLQTIPQAFSHDDQMKVADFVAKNGINYKTLPDQLKSSKFNRTKIARIERTLRLADVTLSHPPLMQHLQQLTAADPDGSLESLTGLRRDRWIDLAHAYGVPAGTDQTPEAYARQLEAGVEALHPTAMLAGRFNSGDLVIRRPGFEKAGTFLTNNPDFDIVNTNLPVYAAKANFSGVENKDQLIKSLLKMQRVKRLSASWDEAGAMLNTGYESALDVVKAGRTRMIQCLSRQSDPERALSIYQRAQRAHDVSLMLMSGLLPRFSPTPVAAMGDATRVLDLSAAGTYAAGISDSNYPTLQSLFGPLDNAEYDFDQSVLGSAAYFVDLLEFLNTKTDNPATNPLLALLQRRPDLVDLQLSSDNTDTELPHIDLVLEILENAVTLPYSVDLPGVDVDTALAADPLKSPVTDALQSTSLGVIGSDLKAFEESRDQRKLTDDWGNIWIVDDGQRRWTLYGQNEDALTAHIPGQSASKIPFSRKDVALLNKGKLSDNIKNHIEPLLRQQANTNYLSIADFTVSATTSGKKWQIDCRLAADIVINSNKNQSTLKIKSPAGQEVFRETYSPASCQVMMNGLNNGTINGPLQGLISPLPEFEMRTVKPGNVFSIITGPIGILLEQQPAYLAIMALSYQTVGNSADLIASPENQNPIAYDVLRQACFPWSLPFNLPLESVRACLERAGITRRQLIELSKPEQYLNDSSWQYELLGISGEEAALIENRAGDWQEWGLRPDASGKVQVYDASAGKYVPEIGTAEPLEVLSRVSILMQQTRVSYDELLRILQTSYVGASVGIDRVDPAGSDCNPCNLTVSGLNSGDLVYIHNFIRLWRRLGWGIEELDKAIYPFEEKLYKNDVLAVLTRSGDYAKVQVLSYDRNLSIRWMTYRANVLSQGETVIRGTYSFSFETGVSGSTDDVCWIMMSATQRQLAPLGNARIVNLGQVNFNAIDAAQLAGYNYSTNPIPGNNDSTNQLVNNDVFAVHTRDGDYAKVQVISYGRDLSIRWVTYKPVNSDPNVLSQGTTVILGTYSFNCELGVVGSSGDIWWAMDSATQRRMAPSGDARIVNLGQVDFNAIGAAQLAGYNYSADPISGNNDSTNQLVNNDVFAVHTQNGDYAKLQVISYGQDLSVRWVTFKPVNSDPNVLSEGTTQITGTYCFNCETGQVIGNGGDLWWAIDTATQRRMVPLGNAKLANLGQVDFNAIGAAQLKGYNYSANPITGNNDSTNQLINNDVFAVLTQNGDYAKLQVISYGQDLSVRWVTYKPIAVPNPDPNVLSEGTIQIPGTYHFNFESGTLGTNGDIYWEMVSSTRRQIAPMSRARIVNLGQVDFNAIGAAQLAGSNYGTAPIRGSEPGLPASSPFSHSCFLFLAHIKRMQEILNLPVGVLVSWWGGPSTFLDRPYTPPGRPAAKSFYEQIFLNPLAQNPPDDAFLLNPEGNALLYPGKASLREKSQLISAALGINQDDFSQLLRGSMVGKLTLDALFKLNRITGLARALGLSISDYHACVKLIRAVPFASTAALIKFCEAVQFIQNSGFSVQELAYLLQHDPSAASMLDLNTIRVSQILQTIRSAMQARLGSIEQQIRNIIANNSGGPTVISVLVPDASVAADAAALAVGFTHPGDSISNVTGNLILLPNGVNGTTITWNSDTPSLVDNSGKLSSPRPAVDTPVVLTATIKMNGASSSITKPFTAVVLAALTGEQAVAADAAALTIEFIHQVDEASSVTGDLILPAHGNNNTNISWDIPAKQSAVKVNGTLGSVTRPPIGSPDAVVTLTATISLPGTSSVTRSFTVVVLANLTDVQAVAADAASLAITFLPGDSDSGVSNPSLNLQVSGPNGTVITWTVIDSNYPQAQVITIPSPPPASPPSASVPLNYVSAAVTRPSLGYPNAYLVLGATLTRNRFSTKRVFYPKAILDLIPLDPSRLGVVLNLTDPNDESGLNVHDLLSDTLVGQVAGLFGLAIPIARNLLITRNTFTAAILQNPSDSTRDAIEVFFDKDFIKKDGVDIQAASDLTRLLHKVSLLLTRLKVKPAEIDWITRSIGFETLDFNKLPLTGAGYVSLFRSWQKLVTLFQIRDNIPGMGALLAQYVTKLFELLQSPGNRRSILASLIGTGLGLPAESKEWYYSKIADQVGINSLDDYRNPLKLKELINLFGAMKRLGATMDDVNLLAWLEPGQSVQDPWVLAEKTARALLRAKYGAESWNAIIKPISDALRIRQRDALVDYLLTLNNLRDANEVYEYYLIDTQMSPHMLTSRLVQATAAVQLFVQRCLLNLESVTLTEEDCRRWEWMKNYRVWEANREIFLFPENWLYPELRDDKTETFKALESGINQGEPKDQLGKDNLFNYMDELNEISKITVYGMYENIDDSGNRVLYVVGRSPNQPYNYYWRQSNAFGDVRNMKWSGWEQIMDISDDHVMPFVLDNDLHIAWPTITKKTHAPDNNPDNQYNYWEIKLNWIRRTNNGWTKKKVSKDQLPLPNGSPIKCNSIGSNADKEITFRLEPGQDQRSVIFSVYNNKETLDLDIEGVFNTSTKPDETGALSMNNNQYYAGLYNKFIQLYKQNLGQNLGTVTFTINPYEKIISTDPLPCYYLTAATKTVTFYYYVHVYDPVSNGYKIIRYEKEVSAQSANGGWIFQHQFDWYEFELIVYKLAPKPDLSPDEAKNYPPCIDGFVVMYNGLKIATRGFTSNTVIIDSFSINVILDDVISSWRRIPIGRFTLNTFGDIAVDLPVGDDAPPPVDAVTCYANGYFTPGNENGLLLNTTNTDTITIGTVTLPGLVIPSSRQEVLALSSEHVWHFEYRPPVITSTYNPFRCYILGENNNIQLTNSYLGIFDNIQVTAALRPSSPNFDDLFLPSNQEKLQVQNFEWNFWADGEKFRSLDPTGFSPQVPFSLYNWELMYHAPMLIAEFLTKQQRFADAQRWLHYVFNPTKPDNSGNVTGAAQFWQFLPFRQIASGDILQKLFDSLAQGDSSADFITSIDDWRNNPFLPFLVARSPIRWRSFQWRTIFAYLDNLIAWGDQMFRRFTRESINEAIQYYILASKLLGPRPRNIKPQHMPPPVSYRDLYINGDRWDDFSNAWYYFLDHSLSWDFNAADHKLPQSGTAPSLTSMGMLYFGIPANDKLMGYWDMVEDRLFKIRNCKDIDGVTRELPLFSPPIDPGLLVRATAAGLDINTVLADMDAPLLPYRFNIVVQKASEICAEVKSLGSALLAALEKKDAEGLSLLRSGQEVALLNLVTQVKQRQMDEANANIDSLNQNMAVAMARFAQYQKLLGKVVSIDSNGIPVFSSGSSLQVSANASGEEAGLGLIQYEVDQLNSLELAHNYQEAAGIVSTIAGVLHAIPESQTGCMVEYLHIGGTHLGNAANAVASVLNILANNASHEANKKNLFASYQRRQDEWVFQSKLAFEEMKQIDKQVVAAQIRLDIAQKELDNHLKQIDNAQAVDDFMHDKYTNQELYSWMTGQISNVYFSCYQLAYDTAKRAEKAFRSELGLDDSHFIQFGYWDSLKKGLLAGDNLSLDLKRMEIAYLEQNRREFEITKHISLLQLNPLALIQLKETGTCEVVLPEALYDVDFPGHYFRRIKSVSVTIPCVAGPYTGVNCTLTLLKNTVRVKPSLLNGNQYGRGNSGDDKRFQDYSVPVQSIATSHGQNDSGMFELNFRDERYLPFEGAGAISGWRIELPNAFRQFDYDTISDVIMHLKYTAREGGDLLGSKATGELMSGLKQASAEGCVRLFSIRHEFPTEWAKFNGTALDNNTQTANLPITLRQEYFPFWSRGLVKNIARVTVYAKGATESVSLTDDQGTNRKEMVPVPNCEEILSAVIQLPPAIAHNPQWPVPVSLNLTNNKMDELWLAVTWSSGD